ncbi:DUF4013 domain-containing protein [Methanotorris igneus]|uniref:DUF4013 domain-containing protein n=1 Tax=Methanotorris igneus (strain DSM 5666 / JCM 11834 / Kol 5) TaxID=880724 RepID=F6BDX3_METIK|nr:DUF4013 domain-containing protein [Methanotorris igneus]AEF96684.1 hypothetical protein Metig_1145 [Methanotorris igneus Kol 5]
MDIIEGLKFPMDDEEWVKKVIIGGIIGIIPIVNLIVGGYFVETMKYVITGKKVLPEWENWGGKFITGICVFIIGLIYFAIPLVVMILLGGLGALVGKNSSIVGFVLGFVLFIVFGFAMPMAIANYAAKEKLSAAFEFEEILGRIKSVIGDYLLAYVVLFILVFVLDLVSMIPIIGWILSIFAMFYLSLVAVYYFGTLYRESSK